MEGGCGLRPARMIRSMGVLVRRGYVAEVGRRRLASNKPAKRTSKKVAGASERWPSSEWSWRISRKGASVRKASMSVSREEASGVGLWRLYAARPAKASHGVTSAMQRSVHLSKGGGSVACPAL